MFDCDAFDPSAFENDCAGGGWRPWRLPYEEPWQRKARIRADRIVMGVVPGPGDDGHHDLAFYQDLWLRYQRKRAEGSLPDELTLN